MEKREQNWIFTQVGNDPSLREENSRRDLIRYFGV